MSDIIFTKIKKEYDDYYKSLLRNGKLPMWSTGDMRVSSDMVSEFRRANLAGHSNSLTSHGFWNAAIADEVYSAFKRIRLNQFKNFLDIGSGDGKVVLIASLFCQNAEGVEIDKSLHDKANEICMKLRIQNAKFYNVDFFGHDFSKHDILFLNPDTPLERGLEKKLINEMKGKLIHYGHHFHPRFLKKGDNFFVNGNLVCVYSK